MTAVIVTEVVANQGKTCAFQALGETLGVGRQTQGGFWELRMTDGSAQLCADFDAMRTFIRDAAPGGHACFERRRIHARRHHHCAA